jgi:hypothetical protein
MPQDKQTLKDLFLDDPEMLRMLELREQTGLLKQLAEKNDVPQVPELLKLLELKEQTKHLQEIAANKELQKGDKGEQGEQGEQGFAGIDGKDGKDGKDGRDGVDGVDGKDGKDGEHGVSPTKKELKTLLNTLINELEAGDFGAITKDEAELIAKKHITSSSNSIKQEIATLRGYVERNYGGHGGGKGTGGSTLAMEIPVGAVDGQNTIFTVSNEPLYIEVSGQIMVSDAQDPTQFGYVYAALTVTFVNAPTQTPHSYFNS